MRRKKDCVFSETRNLGQFLFSLTFPFWKFPFSLPCVSIFSLFRSRSISLIQFSLPSNIFWPENLEINTVLKQSQSWSDIICDWTTTSWSWNSKVDTPPKVDWNDDDGRLSNTKVIKQQLAQIIILKKYEINQMYDKYFYWWKKPFQILKLHHRHLHHFINLEKFGQLIDEIWFWNFSLFSDTFKFKLKD